MSLKMKEALQQMNVNDPPIEVNQRWIALNEDGEVFRRIRILAKHPDDIDGKPAWIFKDEPAKMRNLDLGRLGICPEFNLRYVYQLET